MPEPEDVFAGGCVVVLAGIGLVALGALLYVATLIVRAAWFRA